MVLYYARSAGLWRGSMHVWRVCGAVLCTFGESVCALSYHGTLAPRHHVSMSYLATLLSAVFTTSNDVSLQADGFLLLAERDNPFFARVFFSPLNGNYVDIYTARDGGDGYMCVKFKSNQINYVVCLGWLYTCMPGLVVHMYAWLVCTRVCMHVYGSVGSILIGTACTDVLARRRLGSCLADWFPA